MAQFYWRGTASTAWTNGANWVDENESVYPGARFPGSISGVYDEVFLDQAVTNKLGGIDHSSMYEDLKMFKVFDAYDQEIGNSGQYVTLDVQEEVLIDGENAGDMWLRGNSSGIGLVTLTLLNLKEGETLTLRGKIPTLRLFKGNAVCDSGSIPTIPTLLAISYRTSKASDVTLTLPAGMSVPKVVQAGGRVESSAAITSLLEINDGRWTQDAGDIADLRITGGRLLWNGGNISDATVNGGTVDGSESDEARTMSGKIYDGTIDLTNGSRTITVNLQQFGGSIDFNQGVQFTSIPA